jgi:choline dehydrogenase-like flavoprotein
MPMALTTNGSSPPWPRTGPNRIFPAMAGAADDVNFTLISETLVTSLTHDGGKVVAANTRHSNGDVGHIRAAAFVICADTMRTPQLLFASGIRPPALGRYLNEHAFLSSTIVPRSAAPDELDLPPIGKGEWRAGSYWLPHSDSAQPFHGQIVETYRNQKRSRADYVMGLTWYVPTEPNRDNRIEFSDTLTDVFGMPKMTLHFAYSEADRVMIDRAATSLTEVARALGGGDDWELMPPGSSLHYTGTVRMGDLDNGESVCDVSCKVWGYDNLYVAGNGVIPTAMLGNTTLTGAITAVRAGRFVSSLV